MSLRHAVAQFVGLIGSSPELGLGWVERTRSPSLEWEVLGMIDFDVANWAVLALR